MFVTLGATNHSKNEREENDFYATDPVAMELLLENESFSDTVWECACGAGHLSQILEKHGYHVISTDLFDRGYGTPGVNFLESVEPFQGDIVTNPPYKYAQEFVEHALDLIQPGHKVAMLLRLQFLEGISRRKLFDKYPPRTVYIPSKRITCYKNIGLNEELPSGGGAQAYAWYVWEKPYVGPPVIKWIN